MALQGKIEDGSFEYDSPESLIHEKDRKATSRRRSVVLVLSDEAASTDVVAKFGEVTGRKVVGLSIYRDSDFD